MEVGNALPSKTAKVNLEELGLSKAQIKLIEAGRTLIQPAIEVKLRRAFTVKGLEFFQIYRKLWEFRHGMPLQEDLVILYRKEALRLTRITSPVDKRGLSPTIVNMLADQRTEVLQCIRKVVARPESSILWGRLNRILVPLLIEVARDKGVYMKSMRIGGVPPTEWWLRLKPAAKGTAELERIKDEDPETYALMLEEKKTLREIDLNTEKAMRADGHSVRRIKLMGRIPLVATNEETGEELIYDRDGKKLTIPEYIEKRKTYEEQQKKLSKLPTKVNVPLKRLRKVDDEAIEELGGETEYSSLTDDKAKRGKLTRLYPTKMISGPVTDGEGNVTYTEMKVITGGRYKGIFLDDMINANGRMIEGTAYTYNPRSGASHPVPERIDPAEREPYVTVADVTKTRTVMGKRKKVKTQKMMITIPGDGPLKDIRNDLKELCCAGGTKSFSPARRCIPSMEWFPVKGSRAISVYFDPKDYGTVMKKTEGLALSEAANKKIKQYYKDLANAEEATKDTTAYKAANLSTAIRDENGEIVEDFTFIPSYKKDGEPKEFELLGKQREALAWIDANGGAGVCALETGVGKTLTAIGGMVKAVRDGWLEEDASYTRPDGREVKTNGRFLYVCPKSLVGNMPKEIEAFIKGKGGGLIDRVDCLPYSNFSGSSRSGKIPAPLKKQHDYWKQKQEEWDQQYGGVGKQAAKSKKPPKAWNPEEYVQIYFDEAHALKNPKTQRSQAALKLWHPRKVCLTASPMEKNPMEAYVLAAISNNTPLFGRDVEPRENRKTMQRFKNRFCNIVGGRIVGVTRDENSARDMKTWVKRNVFYADKTKVDEYDLPDPLVETRVAEMAPEVETAYRAVTAQMTTVLQAAAVKFKERRKQDSYRDKKAEDIFGLRLRPWVNLLNTLSNRPADAMRDLSEIASGNPPEKYKYSKRFRKNWGEYPRGIKKVGQTLLDQLGSPEEIERLAETMPNPKLDTCEQTLADKIISTEESGGFTGSRALIFSDDPKLCIDSVMRMSSRIGGLHVLALKDSIQLYEGGSPIDSYTVPFERGDMELLFADQADRWVAEAGGRAIFQLPFRKRKYRKYPNLPPKTKLVRAEGLNKNYPAAQWQQFVLKEIVKKNPEIKTATMLGKEYSHGHNLQTFDTVVHLDRNHWNSEAMKQRTARAWRQGQEQKVQEITIDSCYSGSASNVGERGYEDVTLDTIRALYQKMDSDIFDDIIKASQEMDLTEEWGSVSKRDASKWRLDKKVLDLQASPYAGRSRPPGVEDEDE